MQLIFISGGESYDTYEDFLNDFTAQELRVFDKSKRWKSTLSTLEPEFQVIDLPMPNKENAKFEEWKIQFEKLFPFLEKEIVLVGWSLGGIFLAKYLSTFKVPSKIKATHLVAAPYGWGDFPIPDNFKKFTDQSEKIYLYQSKDDFEVPFTDFEKYKKQLQNAQAIEFEDRNHFLQPEFPELLANIKK